LPKNDNGFGFDIPKLKENTFVLYAKQIPGSICKISNDLIVTVEFGK